VGLLYGGSSEGWDCWGRKVLVKRGRISEKRTTTNYYKKTYNGLSKTQEREGADRGSRKRPHKRVKKKRAGG